MPKHLTIDNISSAVSFASAIPFDNLITQMQQTVTGSITFTINTTGAKAGFGTILRLTANGTNTPDFSAFKKSNASQDWVNTSGTVNVVVFFFDGVDYWYNLYQEAGVVELTQLTAPGSFSAVSASSTQINLSWADVANESNYELQEATQANYSDATTINSPAANATSYNRTGLTAGQTRYYRIRAKGDGVTYSDSVWATANATTDDGSVFLTFDTLDSNFSESPPGTWNALVSGSKYGSNNAMALSANGSIQMKWNDTLNNKALIGLDPDAIKDAYTNWMFGVCQIDTNYFRIENGVTTNMGIAPVAGDIMRIERTGSTVVIKRNGTTIYTFATTSAAALHPKIGCLLTGNKVSEVKGIGIA